MKRFFIAFVIAAAAAATGCKPEYITYEGPSYVMFADSVSIYPVQETNKKFQVPVVATHADKKDRNFGVEIVMEGSDAILGKHYRLGSSTITIPAGGNTAMVDVIGNYESLKDDNANPPVLKLRLVSVGDNVEWDLYGLETKVEFRKVCPFDINNFTGYCLVSSAFLQEYAGASYNRLITTELVPGEENTILLKGLFFDGYDIKARIYPDDLLAPRIELVGQQVLGDARIFGWVPGDGRILVTNYPGLASPIYTCEGYALQYIYISISNMTAGGLGGFGHYLEWLTDAEAEDYM